MKKTICLLLTVLFAAPLFAQNQDDHRDETLFSRSHRSGFFVSPIIEYSNFSKSWTTSSGGGLAFVAGDFFFGAYGLGTVDYDRWLHDDFSKLEMGHGGFWLGFTTPQHKVLHLFSSVKVGWGAVNIDFDDKPGYEDTFLALLPEAGLEVNIFSWLRLAGTVGYRFMNGLSDSPNFNKDHLQTTTGALTIRIGGFGRRQVSSLPK